MESQKVAIIKTLFGVARKFEKSYCYPSQRHILRLVKKRHKMDFSLRTLNRRLKELEKDGYFSRTRRHHAGPEGRILFGSTLYKLKGRAFNWMYESGRAAANFFSFYRLPKMAIYRGTTARDLSSGGYFRRLIGEALQEGAASPCLNSS